MSTPYRRRFDELAHHSELLAAFRRLTKVVTQERARLVRARACREEVDVAAAVRGLARLEAELATYAGAEQDYEAAFLCKTAELFERGGVVAKRLAALEQEAGRARQVAAALRVALANLAQFRDAVANSMKDIVSPRSGRGAVGFPRSRARSALRRGRKALEATDATVKSLADLGSLDREVARRLAELGPQIDDCTRILSRVSNEATVREALAELSRVLAVRSAELIALRDANAAQEAVALQSYAGLVTAS